MSSQMKLQRLETLKQANIKSLNSLSPGLYDALEALGLYNLKTLKKGLTPLIKQLSKEAELIAAGVIPTAANEDDSDDAEGMENQSPKMSLRTHKRADTIVASLKHLYPNSTNQEILNISFRQGDRLHSQWTDVEEAILIPQLVRECQKPVGLTVSIGTGSHRTPAGVGVNAYWTPDSYLNNYYDIAKIAAQYAQAGLQAEADDISTYLHTAIDDMIRYLIDETLPLSIMGLLYGYPIESTIDIIRETKQKTKAKRASSS